MNPTLLFGLLGGALTDAMDRAKATARDYALAGMFGLFGLIFLLIAAFIWLARRFGPLETALGFGVGFMVFAILVMLVHRVRWSARSRRSRDRRNSDMKAAATAVGLAALPSLLSRKAGISSLIVPGIALLVFALYRENRSRAPGSNVE